MNMKNSLSDGVKIALFLWITGISILSIATLIIFSWKWTIIALLWVSIISPLLSMFTYALIKSIIDLRFPFLRSYAVGTIEALLLLFVLGRFSPNNYFLLLVAAFHFVNQLGRSNREGLLNLENREFQQLLSYIVTLPIIFLLSIFL